MSAQPTAVPTSPTFLRLKAEFDGAEFVGLPAAARLLGVGTSTVRRYQAEGHLRGCQPAGPNGRRLISLESLAALIDGEVVR